MLWWSQLLGGLTITYIGLLAAAFTIMIAPICLWGLWLRWWWTFAATTAVLIPLLFWYARSSEDLLMKTARREWSGTRAALWDLPAEPDFDSGSPLLHAAGFREILLVGPRLVVQSWRRLRAASPLRSARSQRAAEIILCLLLHDSGVDLPAILKRDEQPADIATELAFLAFYDWIDTSHDGQRIWILTDARPLLT